MSDQQFEPGSEQFLAAVLYVARDAQQQWAKHQRFKGNLSRWWYLNRVRKQLKLVDPINMPYSAMRAELIAFATSFGVVGADTNAVANSGAVDTFNDIEE